MKVSAQYAEQHCAEPMAAADRGEAVGISRPEKRALRLVPSPVEASVSPVSRTKQGDRVQGTGRGDRIPGALRGELTVPFDDEWLEMDKELERMMNDAPLMGPGGSRSVARACAGDARSPDSPLRRGYLLELTRAARRLRILKG